MKLLYSLSLGAIAVMAPLMPVQSEPSISPSQIRRCVPQTIGRDFIESISALASTRYQADSYVMLSVTARNGERGPQSAFPMLLKFAAPDQKCSVAFSDPLGERISYSTEVPVPVAHSLMLQQWKQTLKSLGKQKYENRLTQIARNNNGILELNKDEFWAFQQLGFKLPTSVKVKVLPR